MYQFYQKLLTKQLGSYNFKILILDEQSQNLARALLPFDLLYQYSICAISDLHTNLNDLTAVAELVFILNPSSLGELIQFLAGVLKYFKITIVFTDYLSELGLSKSQNSNVPPQFYAFSAHFVTFVTTYIATATLNVYLAATLESVHSTGFSYILTVGKDYYVVLESDSGPELALFGKQMFDTSLPFIDYTLGAYTPKCQASLLFNKFRTFMTYGGLAFEFFELLEAKNDQITMYDITDFYPRGRDEFFQSIQEDALFYYYATLPLQDAITRNVEVIRTYKSQKEKLQKTQNLAEIAQLDRLKQQIDRSSVWLRKMLDICKLLGLQQVKELEDDVLSGPFGIELFKTKLAALPPYCQKKMRFLYYLSYGKPVGATAKCAYAVEQGGLLKGLRKCTLEGFFEGTAYKQFDIYRKGTSGGKRDKFAYLDGFMVFGELSQLNQQHYVGCLGCKPWYWFASSLE